VKKIRDKHTIDYFSDGQKHVEEYLTDMLYHRLDGPAYATWYPNGKRLVEEYYIDGKLHRLDGPAYAYWNNDGELKDFEYWIHDKRYFEKDKWLAKTRKYKLQKLFELE
jgi:antitoxin component YwqK of YwqJK toxin-antitoxin module